MKELLFRILTSLALIFILYLAYNYVNFFYMVLATISIFSLIEYSQLIFKINKNFLKRILYLFLGIIYLISMVSLLIFKIYDIKNIIFYFILICIVTDIGGFISGKIFKGKKLTKISPNKTFAGFYGSFIFSYITMFLYLNYLNINIVSIMILTFSVCLLSQLGDIFFSYLKRKAKVKDTGNLLPGHGGFLDRIDGIIISVPTNILFYTISI